MSYDLEVFDPSKAPKTRKALLDWFVTQSESGDSSFDAKVSTPRLRSWFVDMNKVFPPLNGPLASDDDIDSPKVTDYSFHPHYVSMSFAWSEAQNAYEKVKSLAAKHKLGFHDTSSTRGLIWIPSAPGELTLLRPKAGRLKGFSMSVEGDPDEPDPTIDEIHEAVDALTPLGGPGFLVLEGPGKDFAQTAGGDGAYVVEWRQFSGKKFTHCVAGKPNVAAKRRLRIKTNGAYVTVKFNERLDAEDVKKILTAFSQRQPRPTDYTWRDISDDLP